MRATQDVLSAAMTGIEAPRPCSRWNGKASEGAKDRHAVGAFGHIGHKRAVNLDLVERKFLKVTKQRIRSIQSV
jgi:hypothetical protein